MNKKYVPTILAVLCFLVSIPAYGLSDCEGIERIYPWPVFFSEETPYHFDPLLNGSFTVPPHVITTYYNGNINLNETIRPDEELIYSNNIISQSNRPLKREKVEIYRNVSPFLKDHKINPYKGTGWPDDQLELVVSESFELNTTIAPIQIEEALLSINKQKLWDCDHNDSLSIIFNHQNHNLSELGVLALVYFGFTKEEASSTEKLLWAEHVNDTILINSDQAEQIKKPFCISIQTIDITGKTSQRSEPLCIDPEDKDSPYVYNPNGCMCSSMAWHPSVPLGYALVPCLLLLGRLRRRQKTETYD